VPEATRAELMRAATAAGNEFKVASRKEAVEAVAAMEKRGLKVHKPTASDEAAWRALMQEAYPRIRGKIVPEDIFDEVKRLLEERQAGKPANP
jgi:TRAP-type C4-dicarboxylate transport system substrate-binding protein